MSDSCTPAGVEPTADVFVQTLGHSIEIQAIYDKTSPPNTNKTEGWNSGIMHSMQISYTCILEELVFPSLECEWSQRLTYVDAHQPKC